MRLLRRVVQCGPAAYYPQRWGLWRRDDQRGSDRNDMARPSAASKSN
jgi:hypothetical protein